MLGKIIILGLVFILSASTVIAGPTYMKSKADKVTLWNKLTDSVATIGKNSTEKKRIKRLRRSQREQIRLRKERIKASERRLKQLGVTN